MNLEEWNRLHPGGRQSAQKDVALRDQFAAYRPGGPLYSPPKGALTLPPMQTADGFVKAEDVVQIVKTTTRKAVRKAVKQALRKAPKGR